VIERVRSSSIQYQRWTSSCGSSPAQQPSTGSSQCTSTATHSAARLIGIPSDHVAVRLAEWPAHVALKSADQWHSPGTVGYQNTYQQHDPELRWLGPFIAAGFALQTTAMAALSATSVLLGAEDIGLRLVRISIVVNGLYLLGDLLATIAARTPAGDMSSLLRHTPKTGIATLASLIGCHLASAYFTT
jgi:hypothetical protein